MECQYEKERPNGIFRKEKKLINRYSKIGEPVSIYNIDDYEERWGYIYNMFHRQYMHNMLMAVCYGKRAQELQHS